MIRNRDNRQLNQQPVETHFVSAYIKKISIARAQSFIHDDDKSRHLYTYFECTYTIHQDDCVMKHMKSSEKCKLTQFL